MAKRSYYVIGEDGMVFLCESASIVAALLEILFVFCPPYLYPPVCILDFNLFLKLMLANATNTGGMKGSYDDLIKCYKHSTALAVYDLEFTWNKARWFKNLLTVLYAIILLMHVHSRGQYRIYQLLWGRNQTCSSILVMFSVCTCTLKFSKGGEIDLRGRKSLNCPPFEIYPWHGRTSPELKGHLFLLEHHNGGLLLRLPKGVQILL